MRVSSGKGVDVESVRLTDELSTTLFRQHFHTSRTSYSAEKQKHTHTKKNADFRNARSCSCSLSSGSISFLPPKNFSFRGCDFSHSASATFPFSSRRRLSSFFFSPGFSLLCLAQCIVCASHTKWSEIEIFPRLVIRKNFSGWKLRRARFRVDSLGIELLRMKKVGWWDVALMLMSGCCGFSYEIRN